MKKAFFSFFFILLSLQVSQAQLPCETVHRTSMFSVLPSGFVLREKSLDILEEGDPNVGYEIIDRRGKVVAHFEGYLFQKGTHLKYTDFFVSMKRKGFSRLMVDQLMRHHPGIRRVSASLIADNMDAFISAREDGKPRADALRETAFYKVFARHGFTHIRFRSPADTEEMEILVTLLRPKR